MANEGFFHRLRDGGTFRVVTGYDLYVSLLMTVLLFSTVGRSITTYKLDIFIKNATSLSGSLTAVIITGTAILVSLTDSDFLVLLKREDIYSNLMSTFEYTTILSIFVSVFGIVLQAYEYSYAEVYLFIFSFIYLIFAVSSLVSKIVSFGEKKGDVALINKLRKETEKLQQSDFDNQIDETQVNKEKESEPENNTQ
ncbi:hypothetical protein [Haladaptatus cibarius]|uniref:hypothetical protein n=1 Tax=Haladaptatus cibarius TaxID=453847 RepID=UPI0011852EA1|nr:hypothetical protein [Haladaptatus cibarius]